VWRRAVLIVVLAAVGAGLAGGCGPGTATVGGSVTVDGQPLEKGTISYVPADGPGTPAQAAVENGRYDLRTAPGKKLVQISAPAVVGKRKEYNAPDAPLVEVTAERLPERYNSKTELTFEVKPGGNTKDWALETKGRKP
jgi:hypothetical protein